MGKRTRRLSGTSGALLVLALGAGCAGPTVTDDAGAGRGDGAVDAARDGAPSILDAGVDAPADAPLDAPVVCPTAPPFDADDPRLAPCTRTVYVAAGDWFRRAISYDGHHWDVVLPPAPPAGDFFYNSAAIGNGIIVLVGGRGDTGVGIMVSVDGGTTFDVAEGVSHMGFDLYSSSVTFFQGAFWVVASNGTWTSTDGVHWSGTPYGGTLPGGIPAQFHGHLFGSAVSPTAMVVVNDDFVLRRFDGTSWSEVHVDESLNGYFTSIAYGNDRFVGVGWDCCSGAPPATSGAGLRVVSTDDGVTWPGALTNGRGAPEFHGMNVVWTGTHFFASGVVFAAYTSDDGLVWTSARMDTPIGPILYHDGLFLGANRGDLYSSTDGLTWTAEYTSDPADVARSFRVFAVGRVLR